MSQISNIENAINRLENLLEKESAESDFQNWFSKNKIIFKKLNFEKFIEHPTIEWDGKKYIPDFVAKSISGEWRIIELKTANTKVLKISERRIAFHSSMEKYLSQCTEYSNAFQDNTSRTRFNKTYSTECSRSPAILLIAGRDGDFNKIGAREILSQRIPAITLLTYDDILNHLKDLYDTVTHRSVEKPCGLYLYFAGNVAKGHKEKNFFLDIKSSHGKSRVQLFSTEENLTMEIHDENSSMPLSLTISNPEIQNYHLYSLEINPDKKKTAINLYIDTKKTISAIIQNSDFDFRKNKDITIGSDQNGEQKSHMEISLLSIIPTAIPESESIELRKILSEIKKSSTHYLSFTNGQFLYNVGHKIHDPDTPHSTDLIQKNEEKRPKLAKKT